MLFPETWFPKFGLGYLAPDSVCSHRTRVSRLTFFYSRVGHECEPSKITEMRVPSRAGIGPLPLLPPHLLVPLLSWRLSPAFAALVPLLLSSDPAPQPV